jgi:hypothetical protein
LEHGVLRKPLEEPVRGSVSRFLEGSVYRFAKPNMAVSKARETGDGADGRPGYIFCVLMLWFHVAHQRELKTPGADMR